MKFIYSVRKELLEVLHDRTMLSVLIVFPIFIMMFMGSSFGSVEIRGLPLGIVGPTNTTFSGVLLGDLNQSSAFNLISYDTEADAMEAFRNGQLRAVIIIPEGFQDSLERGNGTEIRIAVDNSDVALQEAVLAAMTSVVRASSTNITRSYVSAAWEDLYSLNESASSLAEDIGGTRSQMEDARRNILQVRSNMSRLELGRLGSALDNASGEITRMQEAVDGYDASALSDASGVFFRNASSALNQSIDATEDAHARLVDQAGELNTTIATLDGSILALETIKSAVGDNITKAALDANIAGLKALRGNTLQQIQDIQNQTEQLKELNSTLRGLRASLAIYEKQAKDAEGEQAGLSAELSAALLSMKTSFGQAKGTVSELEGLFSEIDSATEGIEKTLDAALMNIGDVDELITSLQETVAEQTGKDPETLAAPLSVKVENQYARGSFVDFIIPQVIAVSLLFSCFLLASISLVREKSGRTIVRLLMMPGALANAVAAKVAFVTLVSLGQVAIILLVAVLLFGVQPPADFAMLAAGTAVSALVLSAIGMLIGFYARSESAAIQTSLLIAIPMLFLGNIIFSPDLLPAYTQVLLQLLPLAHITNIFKVVLITNGDPAADMAALLSYFVLLALAVVAIVWRRRDITNYI